MSKTLKKPKRYMLLMYQINKSILCGIYSSKADAACCRGISFIPLQLKWQKVNATLYVSHYRGNNEQNTCK